MGRQINFYLTQADLDELDNYVKKNNWLIVPDEIKSSKIKFATSIGNSSFFVLKQHTNQIKINYLEKRKVYYPCETDSPIIEFFHPKIDYEKKIIRRGRVYYTKTFWKGEELCEKDEEFLKAAKKLFSWIRRHFKNAKLPGLEGLFVSERAAQWAKENNGYLPPNNMSSKEWKIWEEMQKVVV